MQRLCRVPEVKKIWNHPRLKFMSGKQAMRGVNRRLKEKAGGRRLGQSHVSHGEQCGFYSGGIEGF